MIFAVTDEELNANWVSACCGRREGAFIGFEVAHHELNLTAVAGRIVGALTQLRDLTGCKFEQLIDLCGSTIPTEPNGSTSSITSCR